MGKPICPHCGQEMKLLFTSFYCDCDKKRDYKGEETLRRLKEITKSWNNLNINANKPNPTPKPNPNPISTPNPNPTPNPTLNPAPNIIPNPIPDPTFIIPPPLDDDDTDDG